MTSFSILICVWFASWMRATISCLSYAVSFHLTVDSFGIFFVTCSTEVFISNLSDLNLDFPAMVAALPVSDSTCSGKGFHPFGRVVAH